MRVESSEGHKNWKEIDEALEKLKEEAIAIALKPLESELGKITKDCNLASLNLGSRRELLEVVNNLSCVVDWAQCIKMTLAEQLLDVFRSDCEDMTVGFESGIQKAPSAFRSNREECYEWLGVFRELVLPVYRMLRFLYRKDESALDELYRIAEAFLSGINRNAECAGEPDIAVQVFKERANLRTFPSSP